MLRTKLDAAEQTEDTWCMAPAFSLFEWLLVTLPELSFAMLRRLIVKGSWNCRTVTQKRLKIIRTLKEKEEVLVNCSSWLPGAYLKLPISKILKGSMRLCGFQLPHQRGYTGIPQRVTGEAATQINRSLCYHMASKCRTSWASQGSGTAPWQWMKWYHIQPENNPGETVRWHINPQAQLIA